MVGCFVKRVDIRIVKRKEILILNILGQIIYMLFFLFFVIVILIIVAPFFAGGFVYMLFEEIIIERKYKSRRRLNVTRNVM